jgi:hypothetical protein
MSLKIAVLSSLTVLGALGGPAPTGDQARNLGPVGSREPLPTTPSYSSSAVEKPEAGGTAPRRQKDR